ncbi:hypothetical protein [Aeromonas veronii]|uniref:hypothetical protein n=1 Tax=Aeromonas veronii TaxID=654 RepID=UPI00119E71ED|nr:hypothetical protein [Aeromonas veronii]
MFELESPRSLFEEIQSALTEYNRKPNSRLFLFIVFSLNHLREWIAKNGAREIFEKSKAGKELSDGEIFCQEIGQLTEFKLVKSLCNKSKHISVRLPFELTISRGFHVGGSCTDSLGQIYYEIDGIDSRKVFLLLCKNIMNGF